jgi:hypothetical protein
MIPQISPNIAIRFSIFVVLLCAVPIYAQNAAFKWNDELCEYHGTYNAKKYTQAQLRNTNRLWNGLGFSLEAPATVFTLADLPTLSVAKLDREYKAKSAELAALNIVKTPYWERLRAAKMAELKQVYELSRLTIMGHTNPSVLNQLNGSESCKTKYAAPLNAGGDALLRAWLMVNEDSRAKNSDPDRLKRIFDEQYASPDRMKYALIEVMTFGWWNCANDAIRYVEYDGSQEREFKKLFVRVKEVDCDEP